MKLCTTSRSALRGLHRARPSTPGFGVARQHDRLARRALQPAGTRCQISSVMKGIIGWSARSVVSSACAQQRRRRLRSRAPRRHSSMQRLAELEVPIAELVPNEVVERLVRLIEPIRLEAAPRNVAIAASRAATRIHRLGSEVDRRARTRRLRARCRWRNPRVARARSAPRSRAYLRSSGTPRCASSRARYAATAASSSAASCAARRRRTWRTHPGRSRRGTSTPACGRARALGLLDQRLARRPVDHVERDR